jgi:CheY-like chemotaxis protein/PAS domain-containing protein
MDRLKDRTSALEHTLLDAVCDASGAAILIVDGDDLVAYASPQLAIFCDIPEFYISPGTRLRDFLGAVYDHCFRAGSPNMHATREVWIADRVAAHWRERLDVADYTSRKRVIRSVVRRLPSGFGICVLTDVTEQKKRDENWRVDLERIKATESILDSLPQPLVVLDDQFTIAATNKAFAAMVQRREDLLVEMPASAVFHASFVEKLQAAAAEADDKGGFVTITQSHPFDGPAASDGRNPDRPVAYVHQVGNVGKPFIVVSFAVTTTPPGQHVLRSPSSATKTAPHAGRSAPEPLSMAKSEARPRADVIAYGKNMPETLVPETIVIVTNDAVFEANALKVLQLHSADHCVVRNHSELQAFFSLVESIDIRIDLTVIDNTMPFSLADLAGQKARSVVVIDRQNVEETLEQRLKKPAKVGMRSGTRTIMPPQVVSNLPAPAALDILVVEDNEVNQIVFSQILDGLGCSYHVAVNAADALSIWQKEKPLMVLMDISLPDMNGMDVCRLMRRAELDGQVRSAIVGVLVPAFDHDRPRCIEAGMDDVIVKPLSPDMIEQLLLRHLGERWSKPAHTALPGSTLQ